MTAFLWTSNQVNIPTTLYTTYGSTLFGVGGSINSLKRGFQTPQRGYLALGRFQAAQPALARLLGGGRGFGW